MKTHNSISQATFSTIRSIYSSKAPFAEYVIHCQRLIASFRPQLHKDPAVSPHQIITANSPFEYSPISVTQGMTTKIPCGALLIHGLFDSPFSMRDIAYSLQQQGILTRSILLPGHGTRPHDLLSVNYRDWIQAVRYGIESLRDQVHSLFLIGFSTGATLSVYHALHDKQIAGIILISPAIKIKPFIHNALQYCYPLRWIKKNQCWLFRSNEIDYTKYCSIPLHPVTQLIKLTNRIAAAAPYPTLDACPILMALSNEDKTISAPAAYHFFNTLHHPQSRLLLYTAHKKEVHDPRIIIRPAQYPSLCIQHFSHVCLPFKLDNLHYGTSGDYQRMFSDSHSNPVVTYGDYHLLDMQLYDWLHKLQLCRRRYRTLTFNPDFQFMMEKILHFIQDNSKSFI